MIDSFSLDINKITVEDLKEKIIYNPKNYKFNSEGTGKKVKIAILDSGYPYHKDIIIPQEKISFCNDETCRDRIGHATMVAGIIKGQGDYNILGFAKNSDVIYGKIVDNSGKCTFNSIAAGILWSIIKNVDIIVLAIGSQFDYFLVRDAVKKAIERDICIFAAAGEFENKEKNDDFPARYPGVFSVSFLNLNTKKKRNIKKTNLYLQSEPLYTTYLNDTYIKSSGSSIATAFYAGIAATFIEKFKENKEKNIIKLLNNEFKNNFNS